MPKHPPQRPVIAPVNPALNQSVGAVDPPTNIRPSLPKVLLPPTSSHSLCLRGKPSTHKWGRFG